MIDRGGASTLGVCDTCGWRTFAAGPDHAEQVTAAMEQHRHASHRTAHTPRGNSLHRAIIAALTADPTLTVDDLARTLDTPRDRIEWQLSYVARVRPELPRPYRGISR